MKQKKIDQNSLLRPLVLKTEGEMPLIWKNAATVILVIVALVGVFTDGIVYCPFERLGVYCLGCGTSHAVRAALALDFKRAFSLNGMFWAFPVLWFLWMTEYRLVSEKASKAIFAAIFAGYFVDYIFRVVL